MKNKAYIVVGLIENQDGENVIQMGGQVVYNNLEEAQEEMMRIISELSNNGCDYDAKFGKNLMSAKFHFSKDAKGYFLPHEEDYFIYEMSVSNH